MLVSPHPSRYERSVSLPERVALPLPSHGHRRGQKIKQKYLFRLFHEAIFWRVRLRLKQFLLR